MFAAPLVPLLSVFVSVPLIIAATASPASADKALRSYVEACDNITSSAARQRKLSYHAADEFVGYIDSLYRAEARYARKKPKGECGRVHTCGEQLKRTRAQLVAAESELATKLATVRSQVDKFADTTATFCKREIDNYNRTVPAKCGDVTKRGCSACVKHHKLCSWSHDKYACMSRSEFPSAEAFQAGRSVCMLAPRCDARSGDCVCLDDARTIVPKKAGRNDTSNTCPLPSVADLHRREDDDDNDDYGRGKEAMAPQAFDYVLVRHFTLLFQAEQGPCSFLNRCYSGCAQNRNTCDSKFLLKMQASCNNIPTLFRAPTVPTTLRDSNDDDDGDDDVSDGNDDEKDENENEENEEGEEEEEEDAHLPMFARVRSRMLCKNSHKCTVTSKRVVTHTTELCLAYADQLFFASQVRHGFDFFHSQRQHYCTCAFGDTPATPIPTNNNRNDDL